MSGSSERKDKSVLDRILTRIPGFSGYVEQKSRQENDERARNGLAGFLEQCKLQIEAFAKTLVADLKLDDVADYESTREDLDRIIQRLRSRIPGDSGFFGSAQVDADRLEDVYDCDANLLDEAEVLVQITSNLAAESNPLSKIHQQIQSLENQLKERDRLLNELAK